MDLRSHRSHARSCRSQFPVFEWGVFQCVRLLLRGNIELYILGSILQARDQSERDATHPPRETRDEFKLSSVHVVLPLPSYPQIEMPDAHIEGACWSKQKGDCPSTLCNNRSRENN